MKAIRRNIVTFYDLPKEWQAVAVSNLDEAAEEQMFLLPLPDTNPVEHVLWDFSQCMPIKNELRYNAYIGISNNSAMLLKIDRNFEQALVWYV